MLVCRHTYGINKVWVTWGQKASVVVADWSFVRYQKVWVSEIPISANPLSKLYPRHWSYHVYVSTHCLHVDSITTRVGTCTLHHVYVYVRVRMVSASVKQALAATVLA